MASRTMRVKVKTAELLAAVEAKRSSLLTDIAAAASEYEAAKKQYEKDRKAWLSSVASIASKAIKEATDNDDLELYSYSPSRSTLSFTVSESIGPRPSAPQRPLTDLTRIDRTIATLKIAADDSILISADDYAEYLG